jgi:ribosomal protection tetracycline resistance protein
MRTLNLGILAHVDAGKTSLTERLLYAAGVIDKIGSVDDGSTQTDSLALERQRGITIKAAVASFAIDDVTINLIDTPGHPDFIAEVERVLSVLDGAVLVISAVEGVQAQTRILMRTLQRLGIPTLIFVNKIDRGGAQHATLLARIAERLSPAIIAMGSTDALGSRDAAFTPFGEGDPAFRADLAEVLAEHDDAIMATYVDGRMPVPYRRLQDSVAAQTQRGLMHPVYFGSAITGAGVEALTAALTELLPAAQGDAEAPVSGAVFKVERGSAGEKVAFVRMFDGTLNVRDPVALRGGEQKITAIRVFDRGALVEQSSVTAGEIGKIWGLGDVQIGDAIGAPRAGLTQHHFAPPTLEPVTAPRRASDRVAMLVALAQLAEQDPLINLRQDDLRQEVFVSLYGEVQKEVIQQTLALDFGLEVDFRETTTICIERPIGVGAGFDRAPRPFIATIGLRVEPGPIDSGVAYRSEVEIGSLPLSFHEAIEDAVKDTLRQGLRGWAVTDCIVTMTHSIRLRHWATSSAGDHRKLAPLVLMAALKQAGTVVCEPIHRFHLEMPDDVLARVLAFLAGLDAIPRAQFIRGAVCELEGDIAAARVHQLQQRVPTLTRGEGMLESSFDHYRPVRGLAPSRSRTDRNPLDRKTYVLSYRRR